MTNALYTKQIEATMEELQKNLGGGWSHETITTVPYESVVYYANMENDYITIKCDGVEVRYSYYREVWVTKIEQPIDTWRSLKEIALLLEEVARHIDAQALERHKKQRVAKITALEEELASLRAEETNNE